MFVLIRTDQGKGYVAKQGHDSYTNDLAKARVYPTHETANDDRCVENEIVKELMVKPD